MVFAITEIPKQIDKNVSMYIAIAVGVAGGLFNIFIIIFLFVYIHKHPLDLGGPMNNLAKSELSDSD